MVNKGRIQRELGKFLMFSSNLIKSDNESMIIIYQLIFYERGLKDKSMESKINEFNFDFAEKSKIKPRIFFQLLKIVKSEIKREIKLNYNSKTKLNAK